MALTRDEDGTDDDCGGDDSSTEGEPPPSSALALSLVKVWLILNYLMGLFLRGEDEVRDWPFHCPQAASGGGPRACEQ